MKKIVAIVVTYNRKDLLKGCIDSLLSLKNKNLEIFIIDNGSTDGTKGHIKNYIDSSKVVYFNTGKNLGGAGGFNFGIKKALEFNFEYIWLMDDDTFVLPNTLTELLKASKKLDGDYGFLSSVALWTDYSICNMNRQKVDLYNYVSDYNQALVSVIMATFVSFFIKADRVKKYGLPISEFFIWADDLEYSRRISLNEKCYVVTESKVIHKMNSNNKVGIENDSLDRLWRYDYLYRNETYLYDREGIKGKLYLFTRILYHSGKIIVKGKDNKTKKLSTIWNSYKKGKEFLPRIEYYR